MKTFLLDGNCLHTKNYFNSSEISAVNSSRTSQKKNVSAANQFLPRLSPITSESNKKYDFRDERENYTGKSA